MSTSARTRTNQAPEAGPSQAGPAGELYSPMRGRASREGPVRRPYGTNTAPSSARTGRHANKTEADIAQLQDQAELYTKRIEMERRKATEMEAKLVISRKKLEETRARRGGFDDVQTTRHREFLLRQAENRLEKVRKRLNDQKSRNSRKKEEIESLRMDKLQRTRILKRLQKEVAALGEEVQSLRQESRSSAEQRDAAQREMQTIQSQVQVEHDEFVADFEAKMSSVEGSTRVRTMREIKETTPQGEEVAMQLHNGMGPDGAHQGTLSVQQERELKHKSTKSYWDIAKREVELRQQSRQLQQLERAFLSIQRGTGIQSVEEMVAAFHAAEDHDFAIISMINAHNAEVEELQVENAKLRGAVGRARGTAREVAASRAAARGQAEAEVDALLSRAAGYDQQFAVMMRLLDQVKPAVLGVFQRVRGGGSSGSSGATAAEGLAATGVTETNILSFLAVIEERIAQIVRVQQLVAAEEGAAGLPGQPSPLERVVAQATAPDRAAAHNRAVASANAQRRHSLSQGSTAGLGPHAGGNPRGVATEQPSASLEVGCAALQPSTAEAQAPIVSAPPVPPPVLADPSVAVAAAAAAGVPADVTTEAALRAGTGAEPLDVAALRAQLGLSSRRAPTAPVPRDAAHRRSRDLVGLSGSAEELRT